MRNQSKNKQKTATSRLFNNYKGLFENNSQDGTTASQEYMLLKTQAIKRNCNNAVDSKGKHSILKMMISGSTGSNNSQISQKKGLEYQTSRPSTTPKTNKYISHYFANDLKQSISNNVNTNNNEGIYETNTCMSVEMMQLEKSYKEMLHEKDKIILQLRVELSKCQSQLKKKGRKKSLNIISNNELNEDGKINGRLFSERLTSYYTPKADNLFRSIKTLNHHRDPSFIYSIANNSKSLKKVASFKSPHQSIVNITTIKTQRLNNCYTQNQRVFESYMNMGRNHNSLINYQPVNDNQYINTHLLLEEIKYRTYNLLNKYSQIAKEQTKSYFP